MTNLSGNDLQQIKDVVVDPMMESMKTILDTHLTTLRKEMGDNVKIVDGFNDRVTSLEKNQGRAMKGLLVWGTAVTLAVPTAFGWVKKHVFHLE